MARRARSIAFPHPVIGIGDDIAGDLRCNAPHFDFGVDHTTLTIDGLDVSNPTIAKLIQQADAAFVLRLGCGATYYRESFQAHESRLERVLPSAKLAGDVEVQVRVCALKKIAGYRPEGLHPDYEDHSFVLQAGDVLAIGPHFTVRADRQFDPLAVDIPSIMRIIRGKFEKGPFRVNLDSNQILIELSTEDHARYGIASNVAPGVLHAALVLPALCEAISHMRGRDEEHDTQRELIWFRRLEDLLERRNLEDESLVVAAQKLLEGPFSRALEDTLKGREED